MREGKALGDCTTTTASTTTTYYFYYYRYFYYNYYFYLRAGKEWAGCTSGLSADQAFWVLREEVSADSDQCTTTTMYYYYSNYY